MRAGLSTSQQTLTAEAASILSQSIAEACRRNHGQTTPLHVAATLLALPSGYLRQACIRSHPNSSHPLQCRALELCFSVALERLPTAQNMAPGMVPPISNALMAALKRAQAHQRRCCPEQQQQPLLAVKVELDQLIISILDDPSVSRVMREASFSSPAVKAAIEQSVNSSSSYNPHQVGVNVNFGPRMFPNIDPFSNRNVYMNPLLQTGPAEKMWGQRGDEVKKVAEIMLRSKKRNPVFVGDSEPEAVLRKLLRNVEMKELGMFRNIEVISMEKGLLSDKNQIPEKIKELEGIIESRIGSGGVILDLGDLKWLVEQQLALSETGRTVVVEMSKLLARFDGSEENKLWLIGAATCETFLRCQVYHSTMETDWDLQAMPMASRSMLPRLGNERLLLSPPMEPLSPLKGLLHTPLPAVSSRASENLDPSERATCCPQCLENYEKEVAKLTAVQKSLCEATSEESQPSLPQWLRNAKVNTNNDASQEKVQGLLSKQKTQELQKKWRDVCLHLHPNFHQANRQAPSNLSMMNLYSRNLLMRQTFQPMVQTAKPFGKVLQLNTDQATIQPREATNSPPESPVRTDLVLGRKGTKSSAEDVIEDQVKDFLGCVSSEPRTKLLDKFSNALDADTYKKLLQGLMEHVWWQAEAASKVASAIASCRLGNRKRRAAASRGDTWLLFTGPDRVGKKKMASVIADQICGASPIVICLGTRRDDEELDTNFRGRTAIDRIAEVVRRNPFSVIMLQDIDEADMLVRGSIKRAAERGRIADSHGREVSLGNAIVILSGVWSTTNHEDDRFVDEKKLASVAGADWQLGLILREKTSKRQAHWLHDDDDDDRPLKPMKESASGLSLDLNLAAADAEDDRTNGSHNSSDLTIDHEDELSPINQHFSVTSVPRDLINNVDETVVFNPVESAFVRREIKKTISLKFSMLVDENLSLEIEGDVVDKILGGLWHDRTSLQEWIEKVLEPCFDQLKPKLPSSGGRSRSAVVRLAVEPHYGNRVSSKTGGDWLPSSIIV